MVGWLAAQIGNLVTKMIKSNLRQLVETKVPPIVNELLEKIDLASLLKPPADLIGGQ